MKNKKGQALHTSKFIKYTLVVLLLVVVMIFLFTKGDLTRYLKLLPSYEGPTGGEEEVYVGDNTEINLLCSTGYRVGLVRADKISFCTGGDCTKLVESRLFLKDNKIMFDKYKTEWNNNFQIGVLSNLEFKLNDVVFITTSETYKKMAKNPQGQKNLLNLDGAKLAVEQNMICREKELKVEHTVAKELLDSYGLPLRILEGTETIITYRVDYEDCFYPRTKPLEIIFKSGATADFIWDARKQRAFVRLTGTDKVYNKFYMSNKKSQCQDYFNKMNCDSEFKHVLNILYSSTFLDFIERMGNVAKAGSKLTGVGSIPHLAIKNKISPFPDYYEKWGNPNAFCFVNSLLAAHECKFFGMEKWKNCIYENYQFCLNDEEKVCGKTCFCLENYKSNNLVFPIGDQEWIFKLYPDGVIKSSKGKVSVRVPEDCCKG